MCCVPSELSRCKKFIWTRLTANSSCGGDAGRKQASDAPSFWKAPGSALSWLVFPVSSFHLKDRETKFRVSWSCSPVAVQAQNQRSESLAVVCSLFSQVGELRVQPGSEAGKDFAQAECGGNTGAIKNLVYKGLKSYQSCGAGLREGGA